MKIALIETGFVPDELKTNHGSYSKMFFELLKNLFPEAKIKIYKLYENRKLPEIFSFDLFVITGSKFGVYDNLSWINPLKKFILKIEKKKVPLFGVCFGHQIMAEAFGGKVEKFSNGWTLGIENYEIIEKTKWTRDFKKFNGFAIHQDQIIDQPPNSTVIAKSKNCSFSILSYGKKNKPFAISIQSHPEFSKKYFVDLINLRKGKVIPSEKVLKALETINQKTHDYQITEILLNAIIKKN
tara:strand:- start:193 stop:912 length:720 start_codon:yes stop_codon:yes gene_type:complete